MRRIRSQLSQIRLAWSLHWVMLLAFSAINLHCDIILFSGVIRSCDSAFMRVTWQSYLRWDKEASNNEVRFSTLITSRIWF